MVGKALVRDDKYTVYIPTGLNVSHYSAAQYCTKGLPVLAAAITGGAGIRFRGGANAKELCNMDAANKW